MRSERWRESDPADLLSRQGERGDARARTTTSTGRGKAPSARLLVRNLVSYELVCEASVNAQKRFSVLQRLRFQLGVYVESSCSATQAAGEQVRLSPAILSPRRHTTRETD